MWATVRLTAGWSSGGARSSGHRVHDPLVLLPTTQVKLNRPASSAAASRVNVELAGRRKRRKGPGKSKKEGTLDGEPHFRYQNSLHEDQKPRNEQRQGLLNLARGLRRDGFTRDPPPHTVATSNVEPHSPARPWSKTPKPMKSQLTSEADKASKPSLAWHEEILQLVKDGEVDLSPQQEISASTASPVSETKTTSPARTSTPGGIRNETAVTRRQQSGPRPAGSGVKVPYEWAKAPSTPPRHFSNEGRRPPSSLGSPFGGVAFSRDGSSTVERLEDGKEDLIKEEEYFEKHDENVTQYCDTVLFTGDGVAPRRSVRARTENKSLSHPSASVYLPFDAIPTDPDSDAYKAWHATVKWHEHTGGRLSAGQVTVQEVPPLRQMDVPRLAHGLDRVLFNEGVHWLRDNRTGIYNFEPRIRDLYDVDLFDYSALPPYQTSSIDEELAVLTQRHAKRYSGSTSSMTSLLSHMYFALSAWHQPPMTGFTEGFKNSQRGYSFGAKLPASVLLRRFEDGEGDQRSVRYAIDQDKEASGDTSGNNYILTQLGKSVEKLLTCPLEEYEQYLRINSHNLSEAEKTKKEAYYYSMTDKFMMRSQLDCYDERLPRKTFDLKTRAVVAVRMDRANWAESSGYMIRSSTGVWESFERELFDMSRGTLLKYFFQARIGNMDGILVAYHSTSTMFGFQYLPREDLAKRLFGSVEMGEQAFRLAIGLLERTLDAATSYYPDHTLRITVDAQGETMPRDPKVKVFVRPIDADGNALPDDDIFHFDIQMDRYLSGALIDGPIDFHAPSGHRVDATAESEIERRGRKELPALDWLVEYCIRPRGDLTKDDMRKRLSNVHRRVRQLTALALPNVEALNARERSRQRALAENPDAWRQYVKDRENGLASTMPLAPGQIVLGLEDEAQLAQVDETTTFEAVKEAMASDEEESTGDGLRVLGVDGGDVTAASADFVKEEGGASSPYRGSASSSSSHQVRQVWSAEKARRLWRMRELARLGQQDKDKLDQTDQKIVYERRG